MLVDDSPAFLAAASRFLATQRIEIVGEAHFSQAAIEMASTCKPDLILLDLELGDSDGFDVLRSVKTQPNPPRVIVVTLHDQDEYREAAIQAGADGFVAKREFATALAPVIARLFDDPAFAGSNTN